MQIDEPFGFGRYKGLTLREVYQGSEFVSQAFIRDYVLERIANPIIEFIVPGCMTFEVSNTLLRVYCTLPDVRIEDEDLTKELEMLFADTDSAIDYLSGNLSIDNFNINLSKSKRTVPEVAGGRPEYIDWCMQVKESFYINELTIDHLQSLPIYRLKGVKINRKIENIYEYSPEIEVEYRKFSEGVVAKYIEKIPILYQQSKAKICVERTLSLKQGDQVYILVDLPDLDRVHGDLGTVIAVNEQQDSYDIEFTYALGSIIGVKTLPIHQVVNINEGFPSFREREDEDDEPQDYADYSHYSTCACGESPCMCSDPDPG